MSKTKRRRYKEKHLIDELKERYVYLEDLLIKSQGYIMILKKMKTKGGEPIDIDILDLKNEVDFAIRKIIRKIDYKLKLYEVPDGIKE